VQVVRPYAYFIERQRLPDSTEWEGYLGIFYVGGSPPFRFAVNDDPPQDQNYLYFRWPLCRPLPLTLRVWSADRSEAVVEVELPPWCP
jgi:hypothetical protein